MWPPDAIATDALDPFFRHLRCGRAALADCGVHPRQYTHRPPALDHGRAVRISPASASASWWRHSVREGCPLSNITIDRAALMTAVFELSRFERHGGGGWFSAACPARAASRAGHPAVVVLSRDWCMPGGSSDHPFQHQEYKAPPERQIRRAERDDGAPRFDFAHTTASAMLRFPFVYDGTPAARDGISNGRISDVDHERGLRPGDHQSLDRRHSGRWGSIRVRPTLLIGLPVSALLSTVMPPSPWDWAAAVRGALPSALKDGSEQRFRESMEHSPIGMLLSDLDGVGDIQTALFSRCSVTAPEGFRALPRRAHPRTRTGERAGKRWSRLLRSESESYDVVQGPFVTRTGIGSPDALPCRCRAMRTVSHGI